MGYFSHHTIAVSCMSPDLLREAHAFAVSTGAQISGIVESSINGFVSFHVAPDGSKEGWEDSAEGDARRAKIKAWLRSKAYADGSTSLKWFEVEHPEDGAPRVIDHQGRKPNERDWNREITIESSYAINGRRMSRGSNRQTLGQLHDWLFEMAKRPLCASFGCGDSALQHSAGPDGSKYYTGCMKHYATLGCKLAETASVSETGPGTDPAPDKFFDGKVRASVFGVTRAERLKDICRQLAELDERRAALFEIAVLDAERSP
jgi:hypothetical protein